jgi:hypothetical protein
MSRVKWHEEIHQIEDARRAALEHRAAAEHHQALATMYEHRVDPLHSVLDADTPVAIN